MQHDPNGMPGYSVAPNSEEGASGHGASHHDRPAAVNFLHKEGSDKPHKRSKRKIMALFALIAIFFSIFAYRSFRREESVKDPLAYDPVTLEPKKPEGILKRLTQLVLSKPVELEGENDDRINVLLLGIGGEGHDGPYLTDTIMLVSIKPSTNQIAMISVPRDLYVNIPGYGQGKINSAGAFGEMKQPGWGAAFATTVIEDVFDIHIPYYLRLDFKAFEEIIDEVGGVKINVERGFTDASYPGPNDSYQTISFSKGVQVMNGQRALDFARSRHGNNFEGSDFARARRQQKVLLALKEKVLSFGTLTNPVRINKIVSSLDSHMTTNMMFSDMIAFAKRARDIQTNHIIHLVFDTTEKGYLQNAVGRDGAYILVPSSGDWREIRRAVDKVFDETPSEPDDTPVQDAPEQIGLNIEIQNGTWRAGFAARVKDRLVAKKIEIFRVGNTVDRPVALSAIYILDDEARQNVEVVEMLKNELKLPVLSKLPENIKADSESSVLVVLGDDLEE